MFVYTFIVTISQLDTLCEAIAPRTKFGEVEALRIGMGKHKYFSLEFASHVIAVLTTSRTSEGDIPTDVALQSDNRGIFKDMVGSSSKCYRWLRAFKSGGVESWWFPRSITVSAL